MGPGLDRLPGPLRQQVRSDQPPHRLGQPVVITLHPGPGVLSAPAGADNDSSTAVTTSAHSGLRSPEMTPAPSNVVSTRSDRSSNLSSGPSPEVSGSDRA